MSSVPFRHEIPLRVRLVPIWNGSDQHQHSLEFGVVGVNAPAKVIVRSDLFRHPAIEQRIERGGIDLPDRLMDLLAIGCFKIIAGFVIDHGGECGTWTAKDITKWLRTHFTEIDATQIIDALALQVLPEGIVTDQVVVGDDDVVLADDYR
jgi:hypothetical protein